MYVRYVDSSTLGFSLSSHRHQFTSLLFNSGRKRREKRREEEKKGRTRREQWKGNSGERESRNRRWKRKRRREKRGDMVESRIVLDVQVMSVTFFC